MCFVSKYFIFLLPFCAIDQVLKRTNEQAIASRIEKRRHSPIAVDDHSAVNEVSPPPAPVAPARSKRLRLRDGLNTEDPVIRELIFDEAYLNADARDQNGGLPRGETPIRPQPSKRAHPISCNMNVMGNDEQQNVIHPRPSDGDNSIADDVLYNAAAESGKTLKINHLL